MEKRAYILIFGGDEVASAIAIQLVRGDIPVVLIVDPEEFYLRHNLCLGMAQFRERQIVDGVEASQLPEDWMEATGTPAEKLAVAMQQLWLDKKIPVLVDIPLEYLEGNTPLAVVETRLPKEDGETPSLLLALPFDAPIIGLAPYHLPGRQVNAAVETRLNYHLGRVYLDVSEVPRAPRLDRHFFHLPFETIHTPIEGVWVGLKDIGDTINFNEALGKVNEIEIRSAEDGQVWGIAPSGRFVAAGQSVGIIFKGRPTQDYQFFSFQERAIAAGVLNAVFRIR